MENSALYRIIGAVALLFVGSYLFAEAYAGRLREFLREMAPAGALG